MASSLCLAISALLLKLPAWFLSACLSSYTEKCPLPVIVIQLFPLLSPNFPFSFLCESFFSGLRLRTIRRLHIGNEILQILYQIPSPWRQEENGSLSAECVNPQRQDTCSRWGLTFWKTWLSKSPHHQFHLKSALSKWRKQDIIYKNMSMTLGVFRARTVTYSSMSHP